MGEKSEPTASQTQAAPPQFSAPRTLKVCYKSWKSSGIRILDAANEEHELYNIKVSLHKPHMTFFDTTTATATGATTGAVIGTANFHLLHCDIDVTVRGNPLKLAARGTWKTRYVYRSPALGGATLTWKTDSCCTGDFSCSDERDVVVARFYFSVYSWKQVGRLELLLAPGVGNEAAAAAEELMVVGLALAEKTIGNRLAASTVVV